jgi:tRNA 5-methylaminomethyl-2-thiouridine biosynthesis bifunctional protein
VASGGPPPAWAGRSQWTVLETDFGAGHNFLATWKAWQGDAQRPALLHYVAIQASPLAAGDIASTAQADTALAPLARALALQCWGLVPGLHRLCFEGGHVLLTLGIGEVSPLLRELDFAADAVVLDPRTLRRDPGRRDDHVLKGVARLCRRGTTLTGLAGTPALRAQLATLGFAIDATTDAPSAGPPLRARFDPAWTPRRGRTVAGRAAGHCLVVGAGLAGAAVAASLARRGWSVEVLDAAPVPAAGASGLPAGLLAPHHSPDDNLLSRLSRAGVRCSLQQLEQLLPQGADWALTGTLEHRPVAPMAQAGASQPAAAWTLPAGPALLAQAGLPATTPALWHEKAAWAKPAALVRAWLEQPGVRFLGGQRVAQLQVQPDGRWQARGPQGELLATADLAVVAGALDSAVLARTELPLQPVRGQVSWALCGNGLQLPAFPLHGNGHLLPAVPIEGRTVWLSGATYSRGDQALDAREPDHAANLARLAQLAPAAAAQLAPGFAAGQVQAWTGIRCASADRRPLVGCLHPGLWVSTAMGSRGLTFAALCAELLAARLHGEPLPLARRAAAALDVLRALPAAERGGA